MFSIGTETTGTAPGLDLGCWDSGRISSFESCAATRSAATAARLAEEVFEQVGHSQWVFVMPKMLRPYFLHHRELLGGLAHAAWETVLELMCAAAGEEGMRPGMVAVVQTAGDLANWHPHVHAIVSRGGWTRDWRWVPVSYVHEHAAELLYRHKVMRMLRDDFVGGPRCGARRSC